MKTKGNVPVTFYGLLAACLLVLLLPVEMLSQSKTFTGNWITSLGILELNVNRSNVTGVYTSGSANGIVKGKLSRNGELLVGTWSLNQQGGRFILRLSGDGNTFAGSWWKGDTRPGGDWIGVRRNATATGVSPQNFRGAWLSNYGGMNLSVSELTVSGGFAGRKNRGTVSAKFDQRTEKLIGNWSDTDHKGRLILNLVRGGNGFVGEWWFEDNSYGGYWYAVRYMDLEACISGNCENGSGIYVWNNGNRYEGQWREKKYHGSGRQYDARGNLKYKGIWAEGVYQGDCISGDCADGVGTLTFINGDQYKGAFGDCQPESTGFYQYRHGDTYEGEFKSGYPHGTGTYIWAANQDKFVGRFSRGRMQGEGTYYFNNGNVYGGNFRRGERYGKGTMTWSNGDRYEGNWQGDAMSGKGIYTYKDGDSYSGEFANGLKNGKGTYTFANGNSILAVWKDDKVDKFDSSSSGYSGLADQSDAPSFPITIINQSPGRLMSSVEAAPENIYLIYKIEEVTFKESPSSDEQKEVYLTYYIVHGTENLDEAAAKSFLKNKSGVDVSASLLIEEVPNPNTRVKQIMSRFRYNLTPTRVSTNYEGYYYFEK
jgi:hypothetical protein